jgi:hypothetical protein
MLTRSRNSNLWMRAALAVLLIGFVLNTVAHAAHGHDPASVYSQHVPCDHCVQFGHLAGVPQFAHETPRSFAYCLIVAADDGVILSEPTWLTASPRGPPHSKRR